MLLGKHNINLNNKPFFIAEMSGNHNQSLSKAFEIVDAAAASGADALKLQTYTPDSLTIDFSENEFFIKDEKSLWKGQSLYSLYQKAMTPWEWHVPIAKRCKEKGIIFFSTPFDSSAVDFLESLDVPFYKIASFENNHLPLIKRVAETKKPIIISTGMATLNEISDLVTCARTAGAKEIALLKCTSAYPALAEDINLKSIPHLRDTFNLEIGLSDHTSGSSIAIAAIAMGATIIEKHFTINRAEGGVDSAFSMEPNEFKDMVFGCTQAHKAIGKINYGISIDEERSKIFRRSIYVTEDIQIGEQFNEKNIRIIRPGLGIPPKYYEHFIGKKSFKKITKGTPLSWDHLT